MRQIIATIRKAFALLEPGDYSLWLLLVPVAAAAALLEGFAALLIFGLITLMTEPEAALNMRGISNLRTFLHNVDQSTFVSLYAIFVAVFFILKNLFRLFESYLRHYVASSSAVHISGRILSHYLNAPYVFHLRTNSAKLIRNTHGAVDLITRSVLSSATVALSETFVIVGIITVLAIAAPWGTLAASIFAIAVTFPLLRAMQSSYARWGEKQHQHNASIQRSLQEAFQGIKEIKVLFGERFFLKSFIQPRAELANVQRWTGMLQVIPRLAVETFFVVGIVIMFLLASRAEVKGTDLIAYLGLIGYALMRLLPSLHLLIYHLNNCRFGEAAVDQLHTDLQTEVGLPEGTLPRTDETRASPSWSRIELAHVSFRYPEANEMALRDISLSIARGESLGIVGPTGAGKSTLVDLLLGLHRPQEGKILLDNNELASSLAGWRQQLGYVSQQPFFVDGTIRHNVALGINAAECDDDRILAALEHAQMKSFLANLPEGLDTTIGESGLRLSGGERQRLAIARALYRNPGVLIFDEATSALDSRTEQALSNVLQKMHGKLTMIIIAHRLRTVGHCDRLVLLDQGQIKDAGTFAELAGRNEDFRQIAGLTD